MTRLLLKFAAIELGLHHHHNHCHYQHHHCHHHQDHHNHDDDVDHHHNHDDYHHHHHDSLITKVPHTAVALSRAIELVDLLDVEPANLLKDSM